MWTLAGVVGTENAMEIFLLPDMSSGNFFAGATLPDD